MSIAMRPLKNISVLNICVIDVSANKNFNTRVMKYAFLTNSIQMIERPPSCWQQSTFLENGDKAGLHLDEQRLCQ